MHNVSDYGYSIGPSVCRACGSTELTCCDGTVFRYDLARWNGPRLILVTDDSPSKRSSVPLLGTVVLPSATQDERVWR